VVHITSMALAQTRKAARHDRRSTKAPARRHEGDVPVHRGSDDLASGIFADGWRRTVGNQLQGCKDQTGERLTRLTFSRVIAGGRSVIIYQFPKRAARAAVRDPMVMIASDGGIENGEKPSPAVPARMREF